MGKNKYLNITLVMLLLFIVFSCLSTISAADINDNSLNSATSEISDISDFDENNQILSTDLSSDIATADVSSGQIKTNTSADSYNDIKSALDDNINSSVTVYIGEGTYSNVKSGDNDLQDNQQNTKINIRNMNVTFIGQGSDKTFIDGTGSDWLFNISSSDVIFCNLSLINAFSNSGSAINSSLSNLTISNCIIKDNYVNGTGYTSRSPVNFIGSSYNRYYLIIDNTKFIDNKYYAENTTSSWGSTYSSTANGGALNIAGSYSNISNTEFINNYAMSEGSNTAAYGGAIYLSTNNHIVYIDNCTFVNNSAKKGGSIGSYYGGNLTIVNSNFINSTATAEAAGLYVSDSSRVLVSLGNNNFINCSLTNGNNESIVSISGAQEVDLKSDAVITTVTSIESYYGEDKNLTIRVTDKSGNSIVGEKVSINLVNSKFNDVIELLTDENGTVIFNLKDLAVGIYNGTITLISDDYNASSFKTNVIIKGNYTFALIADPVNIEISEGQSYTINIVTVNEYNEPTTNLDGSTFFIQYETIDGAKRTISGGILQDGKYTLDISDLELLPPNRYNVTFTVTNDYYDIEPGHVYINVVTKLPDSYSDIDVIYVDDVNGNDKTGTGEKDNPVKSLDVALNMNHVLGGNKTVIVNEGTYYVSAYTLRDNVKIIGTNNRNVIVSQKTGKRGIFFINDGYNIVVDNLTFINGKTTLVPYGAVFSNYYNSNLTITNSIFHNNTGWEGGILYNNGYGTVTVNNCDFYDNCAEEAGAIISYKGNIYIYNSNFTNNIAQYYFNETNKSVNGSAGAVKLFGETVGVIENCTFVNNSAPERINREGGGAIVVAGKDVKIRYCVFRDNYAGNYGGAIYAYLGNLTVYGSVFEGNIARNTGSVLATESYADTIINITNSVIIPGDSGTPVIFVPTDSSSIVYADNNWWGSNSMPYTSNVNINNRIIMTLYNQGDKIVVGLNTVRNLDAEEEDFEGYLPVRTLFLNPSENFTNPVVNFTDGIYITGYNGNIDSDVITATIDNQKLTLRYVAKKLDTVYVSKDGNDEFDGDIDTPVSTIKQALELANKYNSSRIVVNEGTYTENDLNIINSISIVSNGTVVIDANNKSRIFNITGDNTITVNIEGISFVNGQADKGGAIYIDGSKVNINDCTFINNTASSEAGAVYWAADNGIISNSKFDGNSAKRAGAISWGGLFTGSRAGANGNIINCTFNNNNATYLGGTSAVAIYSKNVTIDGSNFTDNHGEDITGDGVVFICGDDAVVRNTIFANNTMESQGVAIRIENDNAEISNCTFINNTLSNNSQAGVIKEGGAIEIIGDNAKITNNTFIANGGEVCEQGGAIVVLTYYGYTTDIENNNFINNSGNKGGAIYIESPDGSGIIVNINNNNFDGNIASQGLAIYEAQETEELNLAGNLFENMRNDNTKGVVIYTESGILTLEKNTVSNCGGDNSTTIYTEYGTYNNAVITVNNNETITILNGETLPLTVTVSDDNGNPLSNGKVTVTADGAAIGSADLVEGIVNFDYMVNQSGSAVISASYDTSNDFTVNTATLNVIPVYGSDDLQKLIDETEDGGILDLEDKIFRNISDIIISKNITITGGNITGAADSSSIFAVNNLSEGVENVEISNVTFYLNNGNVIVLANAENNTNPNLIDAPAITVKENTVNLANDTVVPESLVILKVLSDRNILAPTNTISVVNNTVPEKINPFVFDVNTVKINSTDVLIPSTKVKEYINTIIESSDFNQTAVDLYNGERGRYFIITLKDTNGNPLADKNISIGFNGVVYNRTTDENGSAALQINLRTAGDYTFATAFLGDDDYAGSFVVNTIHITKKVSRIVLTGNSPVKVNAYRTLTVSLQGQRALNHSTYITAANKTVKVTVNGRTYNVCIGANGKGTLRVRFTRAATYTITTRFAGDGTYSAKTATSKITARK